MNSKVLLALMIVLLCGCGPAPIPTGTVAGTVDFKGKKPATPIEILLLGTENGQAANTPVNEDGTFEFETPLPTGSYVAYFAPLIEANPGKEVVVTMDRSIPADYWNESTSKLAVQIAEGENTATFLVD